MKKTTVKIYSSFSNPRLLYVLDFIFGRVFDASYLLCNSKEEADWVYNKPATWFKELRKKPSQVTFVDGALFFDGEAEDKLASIFYCLARIEELDCMDLDEHKRFKAERSVFYSHHQIAWADRWCHDLVCEMGLSLALANKPKQSFSFDFDFGYRFKGKGLFRLLGGLAKDLIQFNWKQGLSRAMVGVGLQNDPFNAVYQYINKEHPESKVFLLLAPFTAKNKGVRATQKNVTSIKQLMPNLDLGLHPAYECMDRDYQFEPFLSVLRNANIPANNLRFHFLRFQWPFAQKALLANGIKADYSMAFADIMGFRAQTAHAFNFYDLDEEKSTDLLIVPLVFMDGQVSVYQRYKEGEVIDCLRKMWGDTQKFGGELMLLWHDYTMLPNTETERLYQRLKSEWYEA